MTGTAERHMMVELDEGPIHVVVEGDGPIVLLVHGFPETSYSWRHQIPALAAAGYTAAAIDVRGYGRSTCPPDIGDYRLVRIVADNVGVAEALGADEVVIVGHDWGAPISWTSAIMRPDLFSALAILSVPYAPPSVQAPTGVFKKLFGEDQEFYMVYFQEPGRAEAEAEADVRAWLSGFYYGGGYGATPEATKFAVVPKGSLMSDLLVQPPEGAMGWLSNDDLDVYVTEFERTGFTGGLNRYRCLDLDWADLAAYRGQPLGVPTLFLGGDHDGPTLWGAEAIKRFPRTLPYLHGSHILPECGHWLQQEKPDEVNELLLEFLSVVRPV
ncbi:MAG: alpha/beta fold hydrolase [Acidimicrobiales bacterium]